MQTAAPNQLFFSFFFLVCVVSKVKVGYLQHVNRTSDPSLLFGSGKTSAG